MGKFREYINKNQGVAVAVSLVVIGAALAFLFWPSGTSDEGFQDAFFSTDDGKSFVSLPYKAPPFTHNGQEAVEARLFKCGQTGEPFVGYLIKFDTPENQKRAEEEMLRAKQGQGIPSNAGMLVKKPGDAEWVPYSGGGPAMGATGAGAEREKVMSIMRPVCEDGSRAQAVQVLAQQ